MTEQDDPRPYETRRDGPAAAGPYETRRDPEPHGPHATRRDRPAGSAYETRVDGPIGRHRSPGSTALLSLPPELASRYTLVDELPDPGTEADMLLVADHAGTDWVVKLYRRGMHADPAVWKKLGDIHSEHVVRFRETGVASGRDYECMEYLPGGNLTALVDPPGVPLAPELVTEVVGQVARGLIALHSLGIVHRDLKPENVLVRRREPLELVVTDFGLARVLEQSMVAASRSGTMAYLAPELLLPSGAQSRRARDWWALGIIARELSIGRRPFEEMGAVGIEAAVMLRAIDLSEVTSTRIQLLCRGLLTRDPEDRWGADQVSEWLAGGTPPVVELAPARAGGRELHFAGAVRTGRQELARALAGSWELAARRYFTAMGTEEKPSEGWRTLRDWLGQFDDPVLDDVEGRGDLIDHHLRGPEPPDVKLLHLLRWLDPRLPPTYRGVSLAPADVAALAGAAVDPRTASGAAAARTVADLWRHDLLPVLAGHAGGAELRPIHDRWHGLHDDWRRFDRSLRSALPPTVGPPGPDVELAPLLAIAAQPDRQPDRLRRHVSSVVGSLPVRLRWVDQLVTASGAAPVGVVTVLGVLPAATAESHQIAQTQAAQRAEAEAVRRRWAEREDVRLAGADAAVTRAAVPLAIWCVIMAALALMHVDGNGTVFGLSLLAAAGCGAAQVGFEVGLARELASDYHPGYSITSQLGPLISRVRPRVSGAGSGCLLIFLVLCGIGLVTKFPPVLFGVVCAWHLFSIRDRRRLWRLRYDGELRAAGVVR